MADRDKIVESSAISSLPFLSFFVHSSEDILFLQPKVNHHLINPEQAEKIYNASIANQGEKHDNISFQSEFNFIPYEICRSDDQLNDESWELLSVFPTKRRVRGISNVIRGRKLSRDTFINTINKMQQS